MEHWGFPPTAPQCPVFLKGLGGNNVRRFYFNPRTYPSLPPWRCLIFGPKKLPELGKGFFLFAVGSWVLVKIRSPGIVSMSDMAISRQLTRLPASSDSDNLLFADYPGASGARPLSDLRPHRPQAK